MNENLNLCEVLKDCPKGTKFYSSIFGEETYLVEIDNRRGNPTPITICGKYGTAQIFNISRKGHPFADSYGECCLWPSKDVRTWEGWQCPKSRFDPKTLKPFDRVVALYSFEDKWQCDLFSHITVTYRGREKSVAYKCVGLHASYVIPYNDDTKYLVGTKDEAPEYYRYWED